MRWTPGGHAVAERPPTEDGTGYNRVMPLLDHFRPPLSISHPWMGFHSAWAAAMAQQLNGDLLPADYYAVPNVQLGGQVEIDVATLERGGGGGAQAAEPAGPAATGGATATAVWAPPEPALSVPVDFGHLELFEVQVLQDFGGPQLRAAVELVSPGNKDRPGQRRAFAIKCASYLQRGVSVIVVDIVTERRADLHAELIETLRPAVGPGAGAAGGPAVQGPASLLHATAYRATGRGTAAGAAAGAAMAASRLDVWPQPLRLGAPLPTLPLWLDPDLCLPLRLEESYAATCESLRIRV